MLTIIESLICRVCAKKITEISNQICNLYSSENENLLLKLKACADIQIDTTDGLPQYVCAECIINLESAYAFKKKCEQSDLKLRQLFSADNSLPHQMDVENVQQNDQPAAILLEMSNPTSDSLAFKKITLPIKPVNCPPPSIFDKIEVTLVQTTSPVAYSDAMPCAHDNTPELLQSNIDCDICKQQFTEVPDFLDHLQAHQPVEENDAPLDQCAHCQRWFQDLSGHESSCDFAAVTRTSRVFTCSACNKSYSEKSNLRRHVRETHLNIKHECDICGREFSQRGTVKVHRQIVHNEEKNYACERCEKRFKTVVYLRRHIKKSECCK